ncbi:MAG: poly-gamma-glutamate biosynthesis protein [Prevotellaceae bacterium]|jgi:serine O-acetyltransferase|nr:poly-gamma-glutamate biosynthesis protein [Prevotellaceae bacterium]
MFDTTKEGLKKTLAAERNIYLNSSFKYRIMDWIKCTEKLVIWRYVKTLRYCGYYKARQNKSVFHWLMSVYYRRKLNKQGCKLGLIFGSQAFDAGLTIYHVGNIVVDGNIGKNCHLHGDNCIGRSKGNDTPTLGDNVRLGVGAKIIGDIYIADNVTVAAGAVVTKSCYEKGVVLAGIPAKIIKKCEP